MAKKLSNSEHIRRFIAKNPDAKPKAIKEALAKKNIEVTDALVSKIKYMSKAQVKQALAEKYERRAAVAKSKTKYKHFMNKACKYRRQAQQLTE